MKKLVVLTGAGISAESGLKTFRDNDGLWMGYDVYEVASPQGWRKDPGLVLDFYNQRRKEIQKAQPNSAHQIIAQLQDNYAVAIITQNIDDLHERAGSKNVLHLHGEIFKMRSENDDQPLYDIKSDILLGHTSPDGFQLRPHVVWFGEQVPMIPKAKEIMEQADLFILVGTSLQVYPAAGLIDFLSAEIPKYIIDKNPPAIPPHLNFKIINNTATKGMQQVQQILATNLS
ncbi:MAG: NAD-dependent deacylase [Bacteroidetes bacterium]|nr:NAD-dependent deacylase [Bacteroidota bacterium]